MSRRASCVLVAIVATWAAVALLWASLGFDAMRSDAAAYWSDGLSWRQPFDAHHVPGYPWLVAVAGVPLEGVPPLGVMRVVALLMLLAGAVLAYLLVRSAGRSDRTATRAMALYGLWPLAGVTYVALPVADSTALAWLLAGVLALTRHRIYVAALLLGAALLTHKATWPMVALAWVAWLWSARGRGVATREKVTASLLLLAPLIALWVAGMTHHGSPDWMVAANVSDEVLSTVEPPSGISASSWLPLGGVVGALTTTSGAGPNLAGLAKLASVAGVALLALVVFASSVVALRRASRESSASPTGVPAGLQRYRSLLRRQRRTEASLAAGLAASVLLLAVALNRQEIWALVRFGRVLAAPVGWLAITTTFRLRASAPLRSPGSPDRRTRRLLDGLALTLLIASQLAYAWYMARVYSW